MMQQGDTAEATPPTSATQQANSAEASPEPPVLNSAPANANSAATAPLVDTGAAGPAAANTPVAEGTASDASQQAQDEERAPGAQKVFEEAFPMDKVQNGLGAAKSFMSWGFGQIAEKSKKAVDDISKSEIAAQAAAHTERLAQSTGQVVSQVSQSTGQVVSQGAAEVGKFTEAGVAKARQMTEDMQPTLSQTQEKAGQLAEDMKPKIKEAAETTRKSLFGAVATAAKTAIWFQSFGASHSDSEDEAAHNEEGQAAAPAAHSMPSAAPSVGAGGGYPAAGAVTAEAMDTMATPPAVAAAPAQLSATPAVVAAVAGTAAVAGATAAAASSTAKVEESSGGGTAATHQAQSDAEELAALQRASEGARLEAEAAEKVQKQIDVPDKPQQDVASKAGAHVQEPAPSEPSLMKAGTQEEISKNVEIADVVELGASPKVSEPKAPAQEPAASSPVEVAAPSLEPKKADAADSLIADMLQTAEVEAAQAVDGAKKDAESKVQADVAPEKAAPKPAATPGSELEDLLGDF